MTTPPRTGLKRLISPFEYRHLRPVAGLHFGGGIVLLIFAGILFTYAFWWALLPLASAAANFGWGYWDLTIARSASQREQSTGENQQTAE
jgi:hypothetical protein